MFAMGFTQLFLPHWLENIINKCHIYFSKLWNLYLQVSELAINNFWFILRFLYYPFSDSLILLECKDISKLIQKPKKKKKFLNLPKAKHCDEGSY